MTGRRRLGVVAAGATLLAAAPITTIFESWTWLAQCILTVGMIAGAATLVRTLRLPAWAQGLSMVVVLLLMLTWMFGGDSASLLPGPAAFTHFGELLAQAGQDTRSYAVPVPDRESLQFVAVAGIGTVAILVDLLTVVARRPALAGLPMLAIYSVPVAVYVDSVHPLPFVVGAAGFLWLLVSDNVDRVRRFGRRFTGDGRDVDIWEPSPLAAAGRRLGVVGVAAAVLLPLLVPTITGGLLAQLTQTGSGGLGAAGGGNGTGRVNLFAALSGQLSNTSTVDLVKVTTDESEPSYLRFGVADQLTTVGFGNRPLTGNPIERGLPDPRGGAVGSFQAHRATVEITDDLRQGYLPVFANPIKIDDLKGIWSYDGSQQVVYSHRATTKGQKYTFDYVRARYTAEQLRSAEPLGPADAFRQTYTQHPADPTVDDRVRQLTKGKTTDYDKVRALYNYFSKDNGFAYSLSTAPSNNSSEIAAFLRNKVGYCQQYAAALAWMSRAAGVPARVAFGFTRGDKRDGDAYVITNRNAHAWTEVYLKGFGWIPFDATPAESVPGASRPDYAPDINRPEPTASTSAGPAAPGGDPSAGPGAAEKPEPGANNPGATGPLGGVGVDNAGRNLWLAAGLALLIALLLVPALRRVLLRRRRHQATTSARAAVLSAAGPGPPGDILVTVESARAREDAHAAWDELLDTMVDYRVPIDPTETPRVTARRLVRDAALTDEPASAAVLLGTAEERARYARRPLEGGELVTALSHVRRGLAHSATRRTRLVASLLPPSTLLRWRVAVADASTSAVAAASRLRDVAVRFSPRRLLPGTRGR